jgi:hypothetical protein
VRNSKNDKTYKAFQNLFSLVADNFYHSWRKTMMTQEQIQIAWKMLDSINKKLENEEQCLLDYINELRNKRRENERFKFQLMCESMVILIDGEV